MYTAAVLGGGGGGEPKKNPALKKFKGKLKKGNKM
jgi:hypothetical protein